MDRNDFVTVVSGTNSDLGYLLEQNKKITEENDVVIKIHISETVIGAQLVHKSKMKDGA